MHVAIEVSELEASQTALDQIQATLSGQEWTADTAGRVAEFVRATGREVKDPAELEGEDREPPLGHGG